ncbi:RrF2 family transcriptional regulator [Listeria costaricensis]|uniref:RrF2 family transcriptional regulator n=1 Tax=Listeria costaricensis TaxID=2026604 RepID=UPI001F098A80|nr:Rrf2 family transcriptional regulator [Listeria costaricensis]
MLIIGYLTIRKSIEVIILKLTKGLEQAACIVALLSTQDSQAPLASDAISSRLSVSPSYLKKIMRKLVVHNIIRSVPGNNGGFFLARSPKKISLLEIVEAVEGTDSSFPNSGLIKSVFGGIREDAAKRGEQNLVDVFQQADQVWGEYLAQISIADLLTQTLEEHELPATNWNLFNQES